MLHLTWENDKTIKKVKCIHADAAKYKVDSKLTPEPMNLYLLLIIQIK